jgi:hypothetical protein
MPTCRTGCKGPVSRCPDCNVWVNASGVVVIAFRTASAVYVFPLAGEVNGAGPSRQRTATVISPMRSNASVITSPGWTGATPWQVPDMMISPG